MNLVAKEYVACQTEQNPGNLIFKIPTRNDCFPIFYLTSGLYSSLLYISGVLILSPFAGAGGLMHEALMVGFHLTN